MKFWDREKEKEWLKRYLKSEPNAILFVYGPKSSGKSTLLNKVVEELPKENYIYYWYDLRERVITGYETILKLFFKKKGWLQRVMEKAPSMFKIPIGAFEFDASELQEIFNKERDAFEEMRIQLEGNKEKGKKPVIVFDELQKLRDVYMNGENQKPFVKELFNFFVRLTKVLHLSHVIVMSSDTFFIEEVYSDSTLKNTSEFYLVDFFDDDTAIKILTDEGLDEEIAKEVIAKIGGVPWMMERVLSNGDPLKKVEDLYKQSKARLENFLLEYENEEKAIRLLEDIINGKNKPTKENIKTIKDLMQEEILFYDPINVSVRFQTKLDELAAKEILNNR